MRKKNVKPNEQELRNIELAKAEIDAICKKYDVYPVGVYWSSDDYGDWQGITTNIGIRSKAYDDRRDSYLASRKVWRNWKERYGAMRYAEKTMKMYPNHRGLVTYEKEWEEPSGSISHKTWRHTSLFIRGLRVKDWSLINDRLFSWNPNKFWMYSEHAKYPYGDVSLCFYPGCDEPTLFMKSGHFSGELYELGCGHIQLIREQSLIIQMVDELIELGIVEIVDQGQVNS